MLHRAGNARAAAVLARRPEVDAIEADVWVRSGEARVHHERPLGPLPIAVDRRGPRLLLRPPRLETLLGDLGGGRLMLDLRSWFGDPAPDLARALLALPQDARPIVSCESWATAARLRAWLPGLLVARSIRSEAQLRRYHFEAARGGEGPAPVSVRHGLLRSAPELESLRRRAGWVAVWTVGGAARARELARWGADAVVAADLGTLAAL